MEIKLTWIDVNFGTQAISIYRATEPFMKDALPAPIAVLSRGATEYADTDIAVGSTYYYRIGIAVDGENQLTDLLTAEVVDAQFAVSRMVTQVVLKATSSQAQVSRMVTQVVLKEVP